MFISPRQRKAAILRVMMAPSNDPDMVHDDAPGDHRLIQERRKKEIGINLMEKKLKLLLQMYSVVLCWLQL